MPVPILIQTIEEAPEAIRPFVTPSEDGKSFIFDENHVAPKVKLDEFRENNKKLFTEKQSLEERLAKAPNAEAYAKLQAEHTKVTKQLQEFSSGSGETFQQVVAKHLSGVKDGYEERIKEYETNLGTKSKEADTYQGLYRNTRFENEMSRVADQAKILPAAKEDFFTRASQLFEFDLQSGTVKPRMNNGLPVFEGSPSEWATKELPRRAPHFFGETSGGGAGGKRAAGGKRVISAKEAMSPSPEVMEGIANGTITIDYNA